MLSEYVCVLIRAQFYRSTHPEKTVCIGRKGGREGGLAARVHRLNSFSLETVENVSGLHFASNRKNLSEFIKLNLFVFVGDGGKCERFVFRFEPKKM